MTTRLRAPGTANRELRSAVRSVPFLVASALRLRNARPFAYVHPLQQDGAAYDYDEY